jgi:hypothetical protein
MVIVNRFWLQVSAGLHRAILRLAAWRGLAGRGSIAMERGLIPWLVRG